MMMPLMAAIYSLVAIVLIFTPILILLTKRHQKEMKIIDDIDLRAQDVETAVEADNILEDCIKYLGHDKKEAVYRIRVEKIMEFIYGFKRGLHLK